VIGVARRLVLLSELLVYCPAVVALLLVEYAFRALSPWGQARQRSEVALEVLWSDLFRLLKACLKKFVALFHPRVFLVVFQGS
jgi:hypothetical protein